MKPIAVFVLVGVLSLGVLAVSAKTVTVHQKDNDRVIAGVSGATPGKSNTPNATTAQPSKKALKASKVRTPPPLHDPN
ncbi:MAG TPA: hypothetical protein VFQ52_05620 [Rhizomicrobium sp.]|nr:hypothetical protein [Rhizomicrobium sp.]